MIATGISRKNLIRYPLAVAFSYFAFFGFVKFWLIYLASSTGRRSSSVESDHDAATAFYRILPWTCPEPDYLWYRDIPDLPGADDPLCRSLQTVLSASLIRH